MTTQHRIAVVDDEKDILENYRELLSDQYEVQPFNSPNEFLSAMDVPGYRPFDLIITDLKMPGMDGIEMVRKAQTKNQHFPVILLSGFLDKKAVIDAVDIGVYRMLEKPTPIATLRSAIDQLLVEREVEGVRNEIRLLTSQLRELYSTLRLVVIPLLPEEILNRTVIDGNSDKNSQKKMSFEDLLEGLESRLDQLLRFEKVLTELHERRYRS